METFLAVGGRKNSIDFNELGVNEVVELLQAANMEAVLLDFGNRNPNEDPVLHFYEHFLKDYDSIMREQRGVYYTPLPVVRFIVRSVHEILQKEFGLADGLADITTWGEMIAKHPEMKLPEGVDGTAHFVQILDPATGTGTFLVEVIDQIEKHLKTKWKKAGNPDAEISRLWNDYVPAHLLPRLNGFELMMAPYAIAHIKLGMKLHETGYRPLSSSSPSGRGLGEGIPRVRVYLTNTLEEPTGFSGQSTMSFITESLALEATGADEIKAKTPITVVVGNPPYSYMSGNLSKYAASLIEKFRYIDGQKIKEKSALSLERSLQDDFVKFFGFSIRKLCEQSLLAIITNNSYCSSPLMRGFRQQMLTRFPQIDIINLYGDTMSDKEENVFNIQKGVAIFVGRNQGSEAPPKAQLIEVHGTREAKYGHLSKNSVVTDKKIVLSPASDSYYFINSPPSSEYQTWKDTAEIFPLTSTCIKTLKDELATDSQKPSLKSKIEFFRDTSNSKQVIKDRFGIDDVVQWKIDTARKTLQNLKLEDYIVDYNARPFDVRHMFYHDCIVGSPRKQIMRNFLTPNNLGLITNRRIRTGENNHFFVTSKMCVSEFISSADNSNCYPLFIYPETQLETEIRPNLDAAFAGRMAAAVGLAYDSGIKVKQMALPLAEFQPEAPRQASMPLPDPQMGRGDLAKNFGPRDVFDYIYAVLHSPTYRTRYADFLKSDFPRIPLPGNVELFRELVALGKQLVALHLLDEKQAKVLAAPETRFIGKGEARVERGFPRYENGKVMINAACWFEDVPPATWEFHVGGYQVCEKWLKDRAAKGGKKQSLGRVLTDADILHYRRVVVALTETRRLMAEIDQVIEQHGGWPGAFMA